MLVLAKAVLAMMIGFITATCIGYALVPLLKKIKVGQKVSLFLGERHLAKEGTPTMGGLIFIAATILTTVILLLLKKITFSENLLIVLITFAGYAILGFVDDYLVVKRNNNKGLSEIQKLFGQLIVALVFFYIFMKAGNEPQLYIYTLGIKIDMGWFYGIFLLVVLTASTNAVNITDGLDGLAGGLSAIAFLAFGLITWSSVWVIGYQDIAIFCFILVGSLLGFLIYNSHPAKIFMGDTGSLALGGALAAIAIITNHELTLVVVAGVFVIETLSSLIQLIGLLCFKKKILLMAPLHHHFEKKGYSEKDIVRFFWVVGLIFAMAAIAFGVWI